MAWLRKLLGISDNSQPPAPPVFTSRVSQPLQAQNRAVQEGPNAVYHRTLINSPLFAPMRAIDKATARAGQGFATPTINRIQAQQDQQPFTTRVSPRLQQRNIELRQPVLNQAAPLVADPNYYKNVAHDVLNTASLALPGANLPENIATRVAARPVAKLAAYGALRGAENAAYGAANRGIDTGLKGAVDPKALATDFATGAVLNTIASPKLVGQAAKDAVATGRAAVAETRIAQAGLAKPGYTPGFAARPGSDRTQFLRDQIANIDDALANHPGSQLQKYVSNTTGDLPESLGKGSGKFNKTGDQIAQELGLSGTDELHAVMDNYKGLKATREELRKQLNQSQVVRATDLPPESVTPKVNETQTRAQLSGRALSTPNRNLAETPASLPLTKTQTSPDMTQGFKDWVNSTRPDTLHMEGQKVKSFLGGISDGTVEQLSRFQDNKPSTPKEAQGFNVLRKYFDGKYQELQNAGVPVGYQENYLKQIWKGTPEQIDQAVNRALSRNPGLTKEKIIADYATGISAGLEPKYTNISDIAAAYEKEANRAIRDTTYFEQGKKAGLFTTKPGTGLEQLQHFPTSNSSYHDALGQKVERSSPLYAPSELAGQINNHMGSAKILNKAADVASELKNTVLSGGIPGTSWNFHGITTIGRDILSAGNPLKAVRNAVTDVAAMTYNPLNKQFLAKNTDQLIELMHAGMTLSTEKAAFKDVVASKGKLRAVYDSAKGVFEDSLFQGFIPATKGRFALEAVDNMVKRGVPREQALSAAAHSANTIFGGNNMAELAKNKDYQNVLRTVFLAPDTYRSLGGTAAGVVKAILKPNSPEYWAYRSIALNTAAVYTAMNVANKASTGHYMYENKPGHTFEVQLGYDTDGNPRYLRPLGQALDFIKIPIDAITSIANGDLNQVARIVQNRLSPILSQAVQITTNTNPFGQPITKPTDTASQKLTKYAANATGSVLPQGIAAGARYATGQTNAEQALSAGLELPFRYGNAATNQESKNVQQALKDSGSSGAEIGATLETMNQKKTNDANNAKIIAQLKNGKTPKDGSTTKLADNYYQLNTGKVIRINDDGSTTTFKNLDAGNRAIQLDNFDQSGEDNRIYNNTLFTRDNNGDVAQHTYDTPEAAQLAQAKDQFQRSGKALSIAGDTVFRRSSSGDVTTMKKDAYEFSIGTNQMQRAKLNNNYQTWEKVALTQLDNLDRQLQDPSLDELEKGDIMDKADTLMTNIQKYRGYGGSFSKPKKPKAAKAPKHLGSSALKLPTAAPRISIARRTRRVARLRPIASSRVSPSYLASLR